MIRAVIDTNVRVSGLLSPKGNEALLLLAVGQGLVRPCLSEEILAEYASVLARPKFAFTPAQIAAVLTAFRTCGEMFRPEGCHSTSPDPADTQLRHGAEAAGAKFILTGNKRHFPDSPVGATRVVNAGELLGRITTEL